MPDDPISVIDLAAYHGIRKQQMFKVLKRLGVEPTKRLGTNNRGQLIAYITQGEASIVESALRSGDSPSASGDEDASSVPDVLLAEQGVFYLLQLEPSHDPGRFKVGYAGNLPERLRALRCSAPFLQVVASWPCKRLWEKTAIESVSDDCERIHTEVFRTASLTSVREKCEKFFAMMPKLNVPAEVSDAESESVGAVNGSEPLRSN